MPPMPLRINASIRRFQKLAVLAVEQGPQGEGTIIVGGDEEEELRMRDAQSFVRGSEFPDLHAASDSLKALCQLRAGPTPIRQGRPCACSVGQSVAARTRGKVPGRACPIHGLSRLSTTHYPAHVVRSPAGRGGGSCRAGSHAPRTQESPRVHWAGSLGSAGSVFSSGT